MKPALTRSDERLLVLLKQAQAQLQQHNSEDAAQSIEQAIQEAQDVDDAGAKARVETLERELRFAMGLMALLLMTGIWGFGAGLCTKSLVPQVLRGDLVPCLPEWCQSERCPQR